MSDPLLNYSEQSVPTVDSDENTWGGILNGVHQVWDRALGGRYTVVETGGDVTLDTQQAQNGTIQIQGPITSDLRVIFPSNKNRSYRIRNAADDSGFTVTLTTDTEGEQEVVVPSFSGMVIALNGTNVQALSSPVNAGGGFRNFIRHAGKVYDGPGMFFQDFVAGFARRASGVIGVSLTDAAAGDQIRFQGANTNSSPLIALAPDGAGPWDTGVRGVLSSGVRALQFGTAGTFRMLLRTGLQLGAATGGDRGDGTINVSSGLFVNNVRALTPIELAPQEVPTVAVAINHGLGGKPRQVSAVLRCVTADRGFLPDDDVKITEMGSSSSVVQAAIWHNETQVGLSIPSGQVFALAHKTAGSISAIVATRWRVVFTVAL